MILALALAATLWLLLRRRRELPPSERLMVEAFRASPEAIAITRLRDGKILEVNAGFELLSGHARDAILGKTSEELGAWSNRDRNRLVEALERDGRTDNLEVTFRHGSGELRECQISSVTLQLAGEACLVAVIRDVTEQKAVAQQLEASEEKFARAFRSSPDSITITRLRDGKFLDVNEGFQKLTGYSYEEAINSSSTELGLWLADERETAVEILRRDGRIVNHQATYQTRSGEHREFLFSAELIELEGEPHLVAISRDVNELRSIEREREELIAQLEAQNAELERFAYTVSHDLKSPLVTIMGFLALIERHVLSGNTVAAQQSLARVRAAGETMERQLGELLDLSRVGRVMNPPEPVSLTELAREAARMVERRLAETDAVVEIADDLPVVRADRMRLLEVLQNLIENAVKFRRHGVPPRIGIDARVENGEVVCRVRDNGIGVDPQFHDKVFGLFERLDRSIEGTGIGLALVRRILEVHGGRIWLESEGLDRGTTVWFTIPEAANGVTEPARPS